MNYYICYQIMCSQTRKVTIHTKIISEHPLLWLSNQPFTRMVALTFWSQLDLEEIVGIKESDQVSLEVAAQRGFLLSS